MDTKIVQCPICGWEFEIFENAVYPTCPQCGNPIDTNNEDNPAKYDNPENF